jgi:hypothetical protein
MALWTPAEITTDLWFDCSDSGAIVLNGSAISQLTDKSGNNRHAAQATAAYQPLLENSGAKFDGSDDLLPFDGTFLASTPYAIFIVGQRRSTDLNKGFFFGGGTDTVVNGNIYLGWGSSTNVYLGQYGSDLSALDSTAINTKVLFTGTKSTSGTVLRKNGSNINTNTNATFAVSNSGAALGRFFSGYARYQYVIVNEIVICRTFDQDTIDIIEGCLAWKWGLESSLPVGHPYKSAAPTIASNSTLCAIINQDYSLVADKISTLLTQDWALLSTVRQTISQDWSLRMLQIMTQYYGDVPVVRQLLDQYWGAAALLRRLVDQPYHDALRLRAGIDQDWGLNAGLLAMMEQRYSIAGDRYLALAEQAYNIKDTELIQKLLDQVYIIQPSGITLQKPVTSVTASATSLFPQKTLHPYHIEIEVDEEEFAIKGEIHLADESEWISCVHVETELTIPIDGTEYRLLVEGPWKSRQPGLTEYYVPMASKTILLDAPYADGLEEELGGKMASVIAQDLANIENITVDWDMIDWFIPLGALYANGETPLAVIRKIVGAAGGIIQSSPAGNLICRTEYPITVPNWSTASPDFYLTDSDNFFSVSSKPDIRDGFNRFSISDQDEGTQGLTLEEVTINSTTKHILVYQVPFVASDVIVLRTSGGTWVGVINEGVIIEDILDEQVEIVSGEGNTTKPIYSVIGLPDYKETELGVITTFESGIISTAILENSLVNISYTTKYRKFIVTDPNIEDVQFFPEIQP